MLTSLYTVLLLLLSIALGHPSDCSYADSKYGVKFNYYGLKISANEQLNYYTVQDKVPDDPTDTHKYTYYFNLCAPVLDYPTPTNTTSDPSTNICLNPPDKPGTYYSYCESKYINTQATPNNCTQSSRPQINGKAYAYQLRDDKQMCYPLSSNAEPSKAYSVSLLDPIDPTQGLTIQYLNGAWSDNCGSNRELTVHLKCEDYASSVPKQTDVTEYAEGTCKYELTVKSIHGCPSGCPAYANSLCASQGLCGYDFSTNRSRCFCFWGYAGSSCEQAMPGLEQWKPPKPAPDKNPGDYIETFSTEMSITNPFSGVVTPRFVNTTYDLTDAHNPNSVYQINDTAQADVGSKDDYRFYFNIGGTINSEKLPTACHKVVMPCKTNNYTQCQYEYQYNISISDPNTIGFAFKYTNNTNKNKPDECIMLGTKMSKPWDKYDIDDNAAHGVKITYRNGSFEPYESSPAIGDDTPANIINCKFTINLICPTTRIEYFEPKDGFIIDSSEVTDLGSCHYEAKFETAFACPYNCITENKNAFSVCNGVGMCIADPSAGFTRCVCDEKYTNSDCSRLINPSSGGTGTPHSDAGYNWTIVIISILIIGFAVAVIYLWKRNKTLEKYAVPILDEHEQVEPTVPDYSDDSDSEKHFRNRPKVGGSRNQEMVTMKMSSNNNDKQSFKNKLFGNIKNKKRKQKKYKRQGKNKYQAQNLDISDDDDDDDDSDDQNGPSAYLAANQNDNSDTD